MILEVLVRDRKVFGGDLNGNWEDSGSVGFTGFLQKLAGG